MKKYIYLIILIITPIIAEAQYIPPHREGVSQSDYDKWTKRISYFYDKLTSERDYLTNKSKVGFLINYSTAYFILKEPTDSVYQKLNKAIIIDKEEGCLSIISYNEMGQMLPNFVPIENRIGKETWNDILNECDDIVRDDRLKEEEKFRIEYTKNKDYYKFNLIEKLERIFKKDQSIRNEWFKARKKYGMQSKEEIAISKKMQFQDSLNLLEVEKIIQEYGYPGKSLVGTKYQDVAMWIIHHASDNSIRDKYFILLYEAATKGEIDKNAFKLFIDRGHMIKFGTQLYGTQSEYNAETKTYEMVKIEAKENYEQRFKDLAEGKFDLGRINVEDYESN